MKKLVLILIVISGFVLNAKEVARKKDPVDPFPWDTAIDFPWKGTTGLWKAETEKFTTYFRFHVQNQEGGRKILKIYEVDLEKCTVVAQGRGVQDVKVSSSDSSQTVVDTKSVKALMVNLESGDNYRVVLKAFKASSVDKSKKRGRNGKVYVMSIYTDAASEEDSVVHIQLDKANGKSVAKCQDDRNTVQ